MGITGGMKCLKFLMFFFNIIFLLCGITLVVVGVMTQVALYNTFMIKNSVASGGPLIIVGVGVMVFLIAFFGCCGAWKESYCMVTMFSILLSMIIIVEIAAAISGYVFRVKVAEVVGQSLNEVFDKYKDKDTKSTISDTLDKVQIALSCCGVNNATDWDTYNITVPKSCCKDHTKACGDDNPVHKQGCQIAMVEFLKKNVLWVIVTVLIIAMLQIMGLVFACLLMRGIRSGYEVM